MSSKQKQLFFNEDARNQDKWRSLTTIPNSPILPQYGSKGMVLYGLRSRHVKL